MEDKQILIAYYTILFNFIGFSLYPICKLAPLYIMAGWVILLTIIRIIRNIWHYFTDTRKEIVLDTDYKIIRTVRQRNNEIIEEYKIPTYSWLNSYEGYIWKCMPDISTAQNPLDDLKKGG